MNPDADPQPPDRDDRPARSPSVRDDALSWLRTPLTMRQLCALGVFLVGGGIPIALVAGGWAWLGLGVMVIIIIAMAMAHERGLRRKRHRPQTRALKRTRGLRRSAKSEGKVTPQKE
jgi:membrane protein implicated in regulation of membrane protease activity